MNSRRLFIEKISKGAVLSTIVLSVPSGFASQMISGKGDNFKHLNIGIIGAENSHTADFGKLFNIDKKFLGIKVKYVWGETEEFAKKAMKAGGIPNMVRDSKDMLGRIDALIVNHRHGKFHLEAAIPFIKAKVPTFIDKPFCYRAKEGKEFLALARKLGTPVTSFSSIAHSYDTFDIKEQLKSIGDIKQIVSYEPVNLNSQYGGVFFYGAYLVQPLLYLFDQNVEKVRINKNGKHSTASLIFYNGMNATLDFTTKKREWKTFAETNEGVVELKSRLGNEETPAKNYVDMVTMFRTGKEPRSHESIVHGVAILKALEKSVDSEQWEDVIF